MAKKTFSELIAQATVFKSSKGKFTITVVLFFQFLLDIVEKIKELWERQAADLLGSVDLSGTPAVYPALERGWWKVQTNVAAVNGGDLNGLEVKAGGQLVCDSENFTYVEDPSFTDIETSMSGLNDAILAEETARNLEIEDLKDDLAEKYKPSYAPPVLTGLNLSYYTLEVGEVKEIEIEAFDFDLKQGGSEDDSEGSMVVFVDNAPQEYDSYYALGSLVQYVVGNVSKSTAGSIAIKVNLPYAQGPILNDTLFNEPYPIGRIPAGVMTRTEYISVPYYKFYGSAVTLPSSASAFRGYSKSPSTSFSNYVAANALKQWIIIHEDLALDKVVDKTNLNTIITSEYVLQPGTYLMKNAAGDNYNAKLYIRTQATAYGEVTEHAVTLKNA